MGELRLADLIVGLSAVTDLGMGQPIGTAARVCLLATWLARELDAAEAEDVYYTALLEHIGCTAYSYESAAYFADEQSVKRITQTTNFDAVRDVFLGYLPAITRAAPVGSRLRTFRSALLHSPAITEGYTRSGCEVGASMARRLGLTASVEGALLSVFEWWNGKGYPRRLRGAEIPAATRLVHVAGCAALFDQLGGMDAAVAAVRERSGGYLDPALADGLCRCAPALLAELASVDVLESLLDAEPDPPQRVPDWRVDEVLAAFGDVVDLKAPFFHGHAARVATVAASAAERLGLPPGQVVAVRRAALVSDLGRAAIPTGVWARPGPFRSDDWSQVRLHRYHSEQVLRRSAALRDLAPIAGGHHERLDGSGYYKQLSGAALPIQARVLATAEAYTTKLEPRPHRAELDPQRAADELCAAAADGKHDADVVDAVLAVAGQGSRKSTREHPGGLSDRQVEVLRLVAAGLSNKQIAARLHISPRTAEHHVQDVYTKLGISSRAPAALFAMQHELLGPTW